MKIFLIGFMGAGKSTIGRKLASRLNYRFADTDDLVEKKAGMTIPEIFSRKGEDHFREIEHEVIKELAHSFQDIIVSTGGGAPCFMNNMEILDRAGVTVYLRLEPEDLYARLRNTRLKDRPLIKDKTPGELLAYIRDKLSEREPFYNRSKLIIDGKSPDIHSLEEKIKIRGS